MERIDYPGRIATPQINIGPNSFWSKPFDEQMRLRAAASEREAAYRKTLRGRIAHWIWIVRSELARMIDPNG
jgi:hypothetical protein